MKKLVKSIIALGTGVAMVGATLVGAMAYDLSQYPAPFVQNGQFNGYIVVGQNAKASDVIGATSIGMALQAANVVETPIQGSSETVVEGGQPIETSSSKLYYGKNLSDVKPSFTDSDFPTLLASGEVKADNVADTYPYSVVIKNPAFDPEFGKPGDETNPTAYLNTQSGSYLIDINFNKQVNMSEMRGGTLTLFGKQYTIGSDSSEVNANTLTLYSAAVDQTFPAVGPNGPATTVKLGDQSVTIKVEGVALGSGSEDSKSAVIDVNGDSRTVVQGGSYIIGGQKIYVKSIQIVQYPDTLGRVRLFIGSDKIVFNRNDNSVKVGNPAKTLYGARVTTSGDFEHLTQIELNVTPSKLDDEVNYIKAGSEFVDPLFGTFKYQFTGETPAYDASSRETTTIQPDGSRKVQITFTNRDGQKITWDPYRLDNDKYNLSISGHKVWLKCNNETNAIGENEYFILNVKGDYTHVLQLRKVYNTSDDGYSIEVKDVATGSTQTFTYSSNNQEGTMNFDGEEVTFKVNETSHKMWIIGGDGNCSNTLFTKYGAGIELPFADGNQNSVVLNFTEVAATGTNGWLVPSSEIQALAGKVSVNLSVDSSDVKVNKPSIEKGSDMEEDGDSHDYEGVTSYGTYVQYNDDSYKTILHYADDATKYNVFLAPTNAMTKTTSTGLVTEKVNPISPTAAVLDSEVTDPMDKNLIVVGGPCVNTVAATLMGNPSDCTAGFEQGKAIIKLFNHDNGKVALLVAGYSAEDTRRAALALADYKDYADKLKGTEVIVSGTDLTNINIEAPAPAANTTE